MAKLILSAVAAALLIASPIGAAAAPSRAEQQLLDIDKAWVDADLAGDRAAVERGLDEGFVATFDAGGLLNRQQFLGAITSGWSDGTRRQVLSDRFARIHGDTGVVVETDTISGTDAGKAYSYQARLTAIYTRRDGVWKAVALHMVRKPPAK